MKKMKILALLLATACFLVACGEKKEALDEAETQSSEETNDVEEIEEEPETQEETMEEATEETNIPEAPPEDLSTAMKGADSSETAPVALNQWADVTRYATEDDTYHTCYVRVKKVTSPTDDPEYLQNVLAQHNKISYEHQQINVEDLELPSDVELCVLEYEVYIPEDFPADEDGILVPDISFSVGKAGGD